MGNPLVVALVVATALAAEPAPLSDAQRSAVADLAKQSQSDAARLKQALLDRQTELAAAYANYTLDVGTIDRLEKEIVTLQGDLLANYRHLQVELRKLVPEDRFERLRRRLDNALQHQPPADRAEAAPANAESTEERVYSGPQAGETLAPFTVRGVFDDDAGKEFDFIAEAAGKPIVLVFVHDVNRPSIALTRTLTSYTSSRAKDGLTTGIVWLDADATEAENTLKRIRHALAPDARVGISLDGKEGPGAYGLNRNVTLTILVGNEGKVTANFALVQPSLQADLPKILDEVVRVAGGTAPPLETLLGAGAMRPPAGDADMDKLRGLLRPVIQRDASEEEVDRAAKALEIYVETEDAARREVGRIANTIISAGKLSNYGTPTAQRYLEKWAKEYGEPQSSERQP
ncbi:MAG: hypothetical protein SGJ19_16445 [Planctomycetia bacterium]|nr:hypothetical protein [Planctomycetia bacterium]